MRPRKLPPIKLRLHKPLNFSKELLGKPFPLVPDEQHRVAASVNGEVIGMFVFTVSKVKNNRLKFLRANGTMVIPKYRKFGIATKMWDHAIKQVKPDMIDVYTASTGGTALVSSLTKKYPKIDWSPYLTWSDR